VAQRSGWREQDRINAIVSEHPGDLRRGLPDEWFGVMDGAHEREVTVVESSDDALFHESSDGPQRKHGIEVGGFLRPVIGVGPCEGFGTGRDLPVRAIPERIVYVKAPVFGQMDAAGGDEREASFG